MDPKAHQALHPISAILVIRQDFFSISCAMQTKESDSYSSAALIGLDDESGRLRLSFNYINKPKPNLISFEKQKNQTPESGDSFARQLLANKRLSRIL